MGEVNGLQDKAAIAGIGQTEFSKGLGRSEYDMAVEAIWAACEDAGISPRDINGIVRYDIETTDEEQLISETLTSLAVQDYPGEFEVLVICLLYTSPSPRDS